MVRRGVPGLQRSRPSVFGRNVVAEFMIRRGVPGLQRSRPSVFGRNVVAEFMIRRGGAWPAKVEAFSV